MSSTEGDPNAMGNGDSLRHSVGDTWRQEHERYEGGGRPDNMNIASPIATTNASDSRQIDNPHQGSTTPSEDLASGQMSAAELSPPPEKSKQSPLDSRILSQHHSGGHDAHATLPPGKVASPNDLEGKAGLQQSTEPKACGVAETSPPRVQQQGKDDATSYSSDTLAASALVVRRSELHLPSVGLLPVNFEQPTENQIQPTSSQQELGGPRSYRDEECTVTVLEDPSSLEMRLRSLNSENSRWENRVKNVMSRFGRLYRALSQSPSVVLFVESSLGDERVERMLQRQRDKNRQDQEERDRIADIRQAERDREAESRQDKRDREMKTMINHLMTLIDKREAQICHQKEEIDSAKKDHEVLKQQTMEMQRQIAELEEVNRELEKRVYIYEERYGEICEISRKMGFSSGVALNEDAPELCSDGVLVSSVQEVTMAATVQDSGADYRPTLNSTSVSHIDESVRGATAAGDMLCVPDDMKKIDEVMCRVHCDRDHFPNGASCTLSDGIMSCVILEGLVSQVCNLPMQGSANGMCGNLLLRTVAIVPASILTTSRAQAAGLTEADLSHPGNFLCMHVRLAKFFAQGRVCLVPEWDPDTGRLRKPIQVRFWVWDRVLRRSHIALDPDCLPGEEWFVLDGERRPVLLENLHGKVLKIKPDQLTITLLGIHCWFAFRNALHRGRELPRFSMRLGLFSKDFAAPNEMFFEDIRTICEEQLAVGLSQRKAHAGLFAILDVAGTFDILESKRI